MSGLRSRCLSFKFAAVMLVLCLAALAAPLAAGASAATNPLVRTTKYGSLEGRTTTGIETTNKAWAWLGVPYAKPPVEELRWKAPRDPQPWSGVRQAKTLPGSSLQMGSFILNLDYWTYDKPVGSEDSLYLNVWTPRNTGTKRPVIFWIHGGANILGESATPAYDGTNFAAQNNAVFVSINYRLGKLGWFAAPALRTGDPLDDSGNYGTLDCIKALQWVHDNIAAFGGDPGNVTIAGQSAGGAHVMEMLISPLAKGLFQRAFSMSGPPINSSMDAAERSANATIRRLLIKDGYASDDQGAEQFMQEKGNAWVVSYMRSKPAADILDPVSFEADTLNPELNIAMIRDGSVLPGSVLSQVASGKYTKVPTILSSTKEEMKFFLPFYMGNKTEAEVAKMAREVDINSPAVQSGDSGIPLSQFIDPLYQPFYDLIAQSTSLLMFKFFGVAYVGYCMSKRQGNLYTYQFNWDEEPKPMDKLLGACHAMDIPFIFHNFDVSDNQITRVSWCNKTRTAREKLSSVMMRYLAQFVRTGNPNRTGLPTWKPWKGMDAHTMVFDTTSHLKSGPPRY
jgi:para-nitrobenzyl esterase